MEQLKKYLFELLGKEIVIDLIKKDELAMLPYYITSAFTLFRTRLYEKELLLIYIKNVDFQIGQIKKQLNQITKVFKQPFVLVADSMHPMNKKRLIENKIMFIIPMKQLFLPELLIDIKEDLHRVSYQKKVEKLTPSAQFILLYHILHRNEKLEQFTFKELAKKIGYTPMGITKAISILEQLRLCNVVGTKEKYIHFITGYNELWEQAKPYLLSPVLKTVFVDELPHKAILKSNIMALPEYSDMAPGNQEYYAIEKTDFYTLQKNNELTNLNEYEGQYCLEVWKYNPNTLGKGIVEGNYIDPLSLYLSIKDIEDERIEMALDQIIEKFI